MSHHWRRRALVGCAGLAVLVMLSATPVRRAHPPLAETSVVHIVVRNRTSGDLLLDQLVMAGHPERVSGLDEDVAVIPARDDGMNRSIRVQAVWAEPFRWSVRLRRTASGPAFEAGSLLEPRGGWTCGVLLTVTDDATQVEGCLHSGPDDQPYAAQPLRPRVTSSQP